MLSEKKNSRYVSNVRINIEIHAERKMERDKEIVFFFVITSCLFEINKYQPELCLRVLSFLNIL